MLSSQLALFLSSQLLLCLSLNLSTQVLNFSSDNQSEFSSLKNIRKHVLPLYQKSFEPAYVGKVDERKMLIASPALSRVETVESEVGEKSGDSGFLDKPTLYTTIIPSKQTSIKHSNDASKGNATPKKPITKKNKKLQRHEKLLPGQYSLPVKIASSKGSVDPTNIDYENPTIEKESNKYPSKLPVVPDYRNYLVDKFNKIADEDFERISNSLKSPGSLDNKLEHLIKARNQIKEETKVLLVSLRNTLKSINNTSQINKKSEKLLEKIYNAKKNKSNNIESLLNDLEKEINKKR